MSACAVDSIRSSGTLVLDEGNFSPSTGGIDTSTYNGLFTLMNFSNTWPAIVTQ